MHSRYARNLYNFKIIRIFEIAWTLFSIILFIHFYPLKNAPGQSQKHFMKFFIMDYCLPLQISTFGPNFFDFHAWVKKCHISHSDKLPKWHFLTHAWKSKNFGPNVHIWSGKKESIIKIFIKCFWLCPGAFLSG